jgi:hypothetical protein
MELIKANSLHRKSGSATRLTSGILSLIGRMEPIPEEAYLAA